MKYWGLVVTILYVIIFVVVILPLMVWILPASEPGVTWGHELLNRTKSLFSSGEDARPILLYFGTLLLAQAALLSVPVNITQKRPVTKRTIVPLIVATSFMMGLLAAGAGFALDETFTKGNSGRLSSYIILAVFFLVWGFWARIFFRWSKKMEAKSFIEKQCKYLFAGSILELLIAVPTHILARHRDYCCAGVQTFLGIAFGISVMFFSFGPGIFFLFAERWQRLRKASA